MYKFGGIYPDKLKTICENIVDQGKDGSLKGT